MESLLIELKKHQIDIDVVDGKLEIGIPDKVDADELIGQIRLHKEDLIAFILRIKNSAGFSEIKSSPQKDYYRVSFAQKRLYLLHEFDRKSIGYNMPMFLRIDGALNLNGLQLAFDQVIDRHESLRTSFHVVNEEIVQQVSDRENFTIETQDITEEKIEKFGSDFVRPFDLNNSPLIRVGILEISKTDHLLMVDMHHIIADGVSHGVLINDFVKLYLGEQLPPMSLQYKDYAEWQQSIDRQDQIFKEKNFWINTFKEEINTLELPTDFPRPIEKQYDGGIVNFELSRAQTERIRNIAEQEGATVFMMLMSLFNILLSKLSNQEDVVVGVPVAGRDHADLNGIIGMFVNTLAIRNYPQKELSFIEFLNQVKTNTVAAFDHQAYPYEVLVEDLNVVRDQSRNPLFDVMFIYQNLERTEHSFPGLSFKPHKNDNTSSKFDFTLNVSDGADNIHMSFEYSTALFEKATIDKFVLYFNQVINHVLQDPFAKVAELAIISSSEKQQALDDFSGPKFDIPDEISIHSVFEDIVAQKQNHTALIAMGLSYSYDDLNKKSNQLARAIIDRGVTVDNRIGILLPRSANMFISLLAILKSGAAYVPIDPELPIERINYMVDDAKLSLILTDSSFDTNKNGYDFQVSSLDVSSIEEEKYDSSNLEGQHDSENLAYLIYTSGSTGNPKGVMITHRNVINFIEGVINRIPFKEGQTILCLTTISFDIFVLESILPLLKGMKVVLADEKSRHDPKLLLDLIIPHKVDRLQVTPSHLALLLAHPTCQEALQEIEVLLVGGEAFDAELLDALKESYTGQVFNMYGPTETTVWSTISDLTQSNTITIGRPISNTDIRIVNESKNLQPIGIIGELWIGGEGVGKGYWGKKDLTKEKFILDPFLKQGRVYKTGDLAKWLPDGSIEFLGRKDNQVKIRGFRIELGEIEQVILDSGMVSKVVSLVHSNAKNDKRLLAFVVERDQVMSVLNLRKYIKSRLPEYMVPTIIRVDQIPLTPNGKVDRKELVLNLKALKSTGRDIKVPTTEVQKKLANIWSDLLELDKVSLLDRFIDLGGHSLLLIKLGERVKNAFGLEVPFNVYFSQSLEQIAGMIETEMKKEEVFLKSEI